MPPKKDAAAGADPTSITGFEARETKLIAAAFVSSLGPDKYDYDLMATLTGNTAGSLKKMWPVVKRKVIGLHPSYGAFLGASGSKEDVKAAPKGKKRKTPDAENEASPEDTEPVPEAPKGKKGPTKGKGGRPKKVKKEVNSDNDGGQDVDQDEESDNEI